MHNPESGTYSASPIGAVPSRPAHASPPAASVRSPSPRDACSGPVLMACSAGEAALAYPTPTASGAPMDSPAVPEDPRCASPPLAGPFLRHTPQSAMRLLSSALAVFSGRMADSTVSAARPPPPAAATPPDVDASHVESPSSSREAAASECTSALASASAASVRCANNGQRDGLPFVADAPAPAPLHEAPAAWTDSMPPATARRPLRRAIQSSSATGAVPASRAIARAAARAVAETEEREAARRRAATAAREREAVGMARRQLALHWAIRGWQRAIARLAVVAAQADARRRHVCIKRGMSLLKAAAAAVVDDEAAARGFAVAQQRLLQRLWRRWLGHWRRSNGRLIAAAAARAAGRRLALRRLVAAAAARRLGRACEARGRSAIAAWAVRRWLSASHDSRVTLMHVAAAVAALRALHLRTAWCRLVLNMGARAAERQLLASAVSRAFSRWRTECSRQARARASALQLGFCTGGSALDVLRCEWLRLMRRLTTDALVRASAGRRHLAAAAFRRLSELRRLESAWIALPWAGAAVARAARRRGLRRGLRCLFAASCVSVTHSLELGAGAYHRASRAARAVARWRAAVHRARALGGLVASARAVAAARATSVALHRLRNWSVEAPPAFPTGVPVATRAVLVTWARAAADRGAAAGLEATAARHYKRHAQTGAFARFLIAGDRRRFLRIAPYYHWRGWARAAAFEALRRRAAARRAWGAPTWRGRPSSLVTVLEHRGRAIRRWRAKVAGLAARRSAAIEVTASWWQRRLAVAFAAMVWAKRTSLARWTRSRIALQAWRGRVALARAAAFRRWKQEVCRFAAKTRANKVAKHWVRAILARGRLRRWRAVVKAVTIVLVPFHGRRDRWRRRAAMHAWTRAVGAAHVHAAAMRAACVRHAVSVLWRWRASVTEVRVADTARHRMRSVAARHRLEAAWRCLIARQLALPAVPVCHSSLRRTMHKWMRMARGLNLQKGVNEVASAQWVTSSKASVLKQLRAVASTRRRACETTAATAAAMAGARKVSFTRVLQRFFEDAHRRRCRSEAMRSARCAIVARAGLCAFRRWCTAVDRRRLSQRGAEQGRWHQLGACLFRWHHWTTDVEALNVLGYRATASVRVATLRAACARWRAMASVAAEQQRAKTIMPFKARVARAMCVWRTRLLGQAALGAAVAAYVQKRLALHWHWWRAALKQDAIASAAAARAMKARRLIAEATASVRAEAAARAAAERDAALAATQAAEARKALVAVKRAAAEEVEIARAAAEREAALAKRAEAQRIAAERATAETAAEELARAVAATQERMRLSIESEAAARKQAEALARQEAAARARAEAASCAARKRLEEMEEAAAHAESRRAAAETEAKRTAAEAHAASQAAASRAAMAENARAKAEQAAEVRAAHAAAEIAAAIEARKAAEAAATAAVVRAKSEVEAATAARLAAERAASAQTAKAALDVAAAQEARAEAETARLAAEESATADAARAAAAVAAAEAAARVARETAAAEAAAAESRLALELADAKVAAELAANAEAMRRAQAQVDAERQAAAEAEFALAEAEAAESAERDAVEAAEAARAAAAVAVAAESARVAEEMAAARAAAREAAARAMAAEEEAVASAAAAVAEQAWSAGDESAADDARSRAAAAAARFAAEAAEAEAAAANEEAVVAAARQMTEEAVRRVAEKEAAVRGTAEAAAAAPTPLRLVAEAARTRAREASQCSEVEAEVAPPVLEDRRLRDSHLSPLSSSLRVDHSVMSSIPATPSIEVVPPARAVAQGTSCSKSLDGAISTTRAVALGGSGHSEEELHAFYFGDLAAGIAMEAAEAEAERERRSARPDEVRYRQSIDGDAVEQRLALFSIIQASDKARRAASPLSLRVNKPAPAASPARQPLGVLPGVALAWGLTCDTDDADADEEEDLDEVARRAAAQHEALWAETASSSLALLPPGSLHTAVLAPSADASTGGAAMPMPPLCHGVRANDSTKKAPTVPPTCGSHAHQTNATTAFGQVEVPNQAASRFLHQSPIAKHSELNRGDVLADAEHQPVPESSLPGISISAEPVDASVQPTHVQRASTVSMVQPLVTGQASRSDRPCEAAMQGAESIIAVPNDASGQEIAISLGALWEESLAYELSKSTPAGVNDGVAHCDDNLSRADAQAPKLSKGPRWDALCNGPGTGPCSPAKDITSPTTMMLRTGLAAFSYENDVRESLNAQFEARRAGRELLFAWLWWRKLAREEALM